MRKNILCDFRPSRNLPDALIEVCVKCGKKVVYNKVKGKTDNRKYLRDHIRDTVQPFGKNAELFEKIYGHKGIIEFYKNSPQKKSKKQTAKDWEELRQDVRRDIRKQTYGSAT